MMPAIQAHLAPEKKPAPSARPRIPNTMTMYASAMGPVPIPARREAPPKRESRPPAAATIAIMVIPRGLWGIGLDDCNGPRYISNMIRVLANCAIVDEAPKAAGDDEAFRINTLVTV